MKIKILIFIIILNGCTFGKIANSQIEKQELLTTYLDIIRSIKGSVAFRLFSYDDQGDTNLGTFSIVDANGSYNINLTSGSASLDRIEFTITQGLLNISQPSLHVTGTTAPGSTVYATAQNVTINDFLLKNTDILTGPANLYEFVLFDNVLHSTIQTITVHFKNLHISGSITKAGTQNITIDTGVIDIPINMSCQPILDPNGLLKLDIGFKFIELFKDGQTANFITAVFNGGGGTTTIDSTNTTLYNEIIFNLRKPGTLFLQSCLL